MLFWKSTSHCAGSRRVAFLIAVGAIATAAAAQQPPPLQLNVPYHCPDNAIVVKHCEVRGGTEVCSLVKGVPNGPLGDEISMPKAQAAALGLIWHTQELEPPHRKRRPDRRLTARYRPLLSRRNASV